MRKTQLSMGLLVLAGLAVGGCSSTSGTASTSAAPTTAPSVVAAPAAPAPAAAPAPVGPPAATVTPPAAKDLTHVLIIDEPYYATEPTSKTTPPSGTLKSGVKVLVLIPGAEYTQIISDTGISAYTVTDGLKPLGK